MSTPGPPDLPLRLALQVDAVCRRFEDAWKATPAGGERPRLEAYLGGLDGSARQVLALELLRVEAHHRRRAGDEPHATDYQACLPDLDPSWLATAKRKSF